MYDTTDLPEYKMKALLASLGLIENLNIGGSIIDGLKTQLMQYNPAAVDNNKRILAILTSGLNNAGTSHEFSDINVTLVIASLPDRSDAVTAKMIAMHYQDVFSKHIFDTDNSVCNGVFGAIPTGVQGPYYEDAGRVVFELSLRLLIN